MIYILRHGQTRWNLEGKKQGWQDSPLTIKGFKQGVSIAKLLDSKIKGDIADYKIVISPLQRCRQYTSIVCETLGVDYNKCIIEEGLKEHKFGEWEGKTEVEIESQFPGALKERMLNRWNYVVPSGESYSKLHQRVKSVYTHYKEDNVVFICHEMVSKVLRGLMLDENSNSVPIQKHSQNKIFTYDGKNIKEEIIDEIK